MMIEERRKLGMPEDMIVEELDNADPAKRLIAPDPDPEIEPNVERSDEELP